MGFLSIMFQPTAEMFGAVTLVLGINIILLVLFAFFTTSVIRRVALTQQESEKMKQEAMKKVQEMTDQTREQTAALLNQASKKSREILATVDMISSDAREGLNTALQDFSRRQTEYIAKTSEHYMRVMEEGIRKSETEHVGVLERARALSVEQANHTLEMFQASLKQELEKYQKTMDERYGHWHEETKKQIEEYKTAALKNVDASIYKIIFSISQKVIGRALNMEDHHRLIIQALEEAKKEGIFG